MYRAIHPSTFRTRCAGEPEDRPIRPERRRDRASVGRVRTQPRRRAASRAFRSGCAFKRVHHFFAVILWVAAGLAFFAEWSAPGQGMAKLGCAIVVVILVSGVFSFWQEYRAEQTLALLRKLLPQQVADGARGQGGPAAVRGSGPRRHRAPRAGRPRSRGLPADRSLRRSGRRRGDHRGVTTPDARDSDRPTAAT